MKRRGRGTPYPQNATTREAATHTGRGDDRNASLYAPEGKQGRLRLSEGAAAKKKTYSPDLPFFLPPSFNGSVTLAT